MFNTNKNIIFRRMSYKHVLIHFYKSIANIMLRRIYFILLVEWIGTLVIVTLAQIGGYTEDLYTQKNEVKAFL
jgi:hypothetical protein